MCVSDMNGTAFSFQLLDRYTIHHIHDALRELNCMVGKIILQESINEDIDLFSRLLADEQSTKLMALNWLCFIAYPTFTRKIVMCLKDLTFHIHRLEEVVSMTEL